MRRFETPEKAIANLQRRVDQLWNRASRQGHSHARVDALDENVSGFTNTSHADLDALSTSSFSRGVSVTVATGTEALVIVSANVICLASGTPAVFVGYRVSGATTLGTDDTAGIRGHTTTPESSTYVSYETGLTAGVNTFELTARASAGGSGPGRLQHPSITVIPF